MDTQDTSQSVNMKQVGNVPPRNEVKVEEGGELGMWALCMASIKKLVLTKKGGETENICLILLLVSSSDDRHLTASKFERCDGFVLVDGP
ncbi:hypothetical protein ACET3Z_001436 [Daucus carota]